MKIIPKITQKIIRYSTKNTVNGRYNRHMDTAMFSGLGALGHFAGRMGHWNIADTGINIALWSMFFGNAGAALVEKIKLQPILKRAKAIHKAAKLAKKNKIKNL